MVFRDSGGSRPGTCCWFQGPLPPPCPLCLLTQSAGEREASRWVPYPTMGPHVNKAPGFDSLQSWPHSCSWLASLPIPGLAPPWAPPSPPTQPPAGTVCQYSGWSVRELRPSNRIWARLLQRSEPEGGKTAEHPCSSGGDEFGKASWRRQRWCPAGRLGWLQGQVAVWSPVLPGTELWPGPAGATPCAPALRPGAPLSLMSHHLEGQISPWAL